MKCPIKNTFQDNDDNIPEEYSEWNLYCQECKHFEECTMTVFNNLTKGEDNTPIGYKTLTGDNYPTYPDIKLRILLHQERRDIIEKGLLAELGRITKDDIIDMQIDLGLYKKKDK